MPSLDRLPLALSRRRLLGVAAGYLLASRFVTFDAGAQSGESLTILGLGLDWLDESPSQRSDIMMLARIDTTAGTIRTLSIPRDLYVEIPGHGWDKINAAYQVGIASSTPDDWDAGATHAARTVSLAFGVPIDAYAVTEMDAFSGIIDKLGGITVENPYALTDEYWPADMVLPAGPLELDGATALMYVRARSQDGDGGRVMRQHLLLEALLARLQEPETFSRLPSLVGALQGEVQTSIPVGVQLDLMGMLPDLSGASLVFTNIEDQLAQGYTAGGAWIYEADWTTLPTFVQSWLDGDLA